LQSISKNKLNLTTWCCTTHCILFEHKPKWSYI